MLKLVLLYLLTDLGLTIFFAAGFHLTRSGEVAFSESLRLAFSMLWSTADPLSVKGESAAFYVIGAIGVSLSILLPLVLLGSFVFKLFQYDPIRWRNHISLTDYRGRPVLVFRFYNKTRQPLVNLHIDIVARQRLRTKPQVRQNVILQVLDSSGNTRPSGRWIYSLPGVPFSIRVPLVGSETSLEMSASDTVSLTEFARPKWEDLRLLAIITGTSLVTGNTFTSYQQYEAARDIRMGRPSEVYADDSKYAIEWRGWENFDKSCPIYLFGYGSLISRASAENTLGRRLRPDEGPLLARLRGFRRAWNVGSNKESHPERTYLRSDGTEYMGVVAVLGVERTDGKECTGSVIKIGRADIEPFLSRERNYLLRDVTEYVHWDTKPDTCSVYTFIPSEVAKTRLQNATEIVINTEYARLLEDAFRDVDPSSELAEFREIMEEGERMYEMEPLTTVFNSP